MRHHGFRSSLFVLVLVSCVLILTSHATAQVVTATLYGSVVDPNGAAVPKASVTALNVGRGTSVTREADE
jgi:hypothetical protein